MNLQSGTPARLLSDARVKERGLKGNWRCRFLLEPVCSNVSFWYLWDLWREEC